MDKPTSMIQDKIISAIKDFSVKGKYRIIGSNATRGVLYGSDYPYVPMDTQAQALSQLGLDKSVLDQIRYQNATALLKK
jgi:predicted TIM-barrel fold metal-dependent hydrolase